MNPYEDKIERRRIHFEHRAEQCKRIAELRSKRAREMASVIPFGQPILVGHHSEKRDRAYRAKIENGHRAAYELYKKAEYYAGRAASVGTGGISSDDPEAIQKLQAEIDIAEANQERMKVFNAAMRKNDMEAMRNCGFSDARIKLLLEPDFCGRKGFAGFELTNNGANIRRMRQRIDQLRHEHSQRTGAAADKVKSFYDEIPKPDGVTIEENDEANRLQVYFPGKPAEQVRAAMKSAGFRWSPTAGAWQRQLNNNARWAVKNAFEQIAKLNAPQSNAPKLPDLACPACGANMRGDYCPCTSWDYETPNA